MSEEILINITPMESRVAVVENGVLQEVHVERTQKRGIDGNIYKADEGDLYNATLQLLPKGTMLVRGYVGMPLFGKSQIWRPVSASDYPKCKPAKR